MNNPTLEAYPLGSWDWDGSWYPNAMLKMSAEDQRQHNIKYGFIKKPSQSIPKERLIAWAEDNEGYIDPGQFLEFITSWEGEANE